MFAEILPWLSDVKLNCFSNTQAGEYVWQTYEEVCQKVMRIGSAIRSLGVEPVSEERLMSLSVYVVICMFIVKN
jgi:hypothetical protein